jgi:hypothetical protein
VTFLVAWLLLPLADERWLLAAALAVGALAALLDLAGLDGLFNVAKVVALTLFGFWFVQMLEALMWIVLVAAVIPWVDIASVYRGPTKVVVEENGRVRADRRVLLGARRGRGGTARPPGRDLLRAVPRGGPALRAARRRDLDRDDGRAVDHADRDVHLRPARPPGAAGDFPRLPAPQRRPALAVAVPRARRQPRPRWSGRRGEPPVARGAATAAGPGGGVRRDPRPR